MTDIEDRLHHFFAADGSLAQVLGDYHSRPQQVEMAQALARTIAANGKFLAEAGTGTGKTFAYLAPAMMLGGKIIVSTGTKNLQDQLFNKDIPLIRKALGASLIPALLKGRANYVCQHHLERTQAEGRLESRRDVGYLQKIVRFAETSSTGDKAELGAVPEDATIWPLVTSTRENCLGSDCAHHAACFVLAARKRALDADLVVVNHHLFFADVMLRDEGVSELLPACNTVIFDEAHQLPETATLFFGDMLSSHQMIELARDSKANGVAFAKDYTQLPKAADALDKAVRDLRLACGPDPTSLTGKRMTREAFMQIETFAAAWQKLQTALADLAAHLENQAERAPEIANCRDRAAAQQLLLQQWETDDVSRVQWGEITRFGIQCYSTPVSIDAILRKQFDGHPRAWIFTSATLAVKGDFSLYQQQLGLQEAETGCWDSPFDYPNQALLYVPQGMPNPNAAGYQKAWLEEVLPVLQASRGRAFLLFTSLRAMREARDAVEEGMQQAGCSYPILMQGDASRNELLERFRRESNAILLGSQSFWEGVDVKGEALSLVVIDRLPFAPPDDPVLTARMERVRQNGGNPFMQYQLPQAVITLKQGAGRLIRDEDDRGVLMICDPRLAENKTYGRRIWQSLPPMKRTRVRDDVIAFFADEGK